MGQSETDVGYAILDENGNLISADQVCRHWLSGRPIAELLPGIDFRGALNTVQHIVLRLEESGSTSAVAELRELDGEGEPLLLLRIQICVASAVEHQYCDVVTGLPDRTALEAHRTKLLRDAKGKLPHALLFLDLDKFKQINDSWGHAVGDRVLAQLADRWRKSLRGDDLIVRYGGDEFAILLPGIRSQADAQPILDRLRSTTMAPLCADGHTFEVSVAIGVAIADGASTSLEQLLDAADKAMYANKQSRG